MWKADMKELLEDIRNLLQAGKYRNEEQVRFSLVARVLQKLDWNIWNPEQVYTEFKPNPYNDNKKLDIALFLNGHTPSVFIEIKSPDKLNNKTELDKAETQLKDYNADLTALFTILTDGNQWRFYYSQEGGTFSQKRFKTIRLVSDDLEDIEIAFEMFLRKEVVQNGKAKKEAYSYLQLSRKQKIMEESMPEARRAVETNPLLNLVLALKKTTLSRGLNISEDEALDFIKNHNAKKTSHIELSNTRDIGTSTRIISTPHAPLPTTVPISSQRTNYGSNPPDLTHTKLENGLIGNYKINSWSGLITVCLRQLFNSGWTIEKVHSLTTINIKSGHITESGFKVIDGYQYSFQGLDANRSARALIDLSKASGLNLVVDFVWRDKQGAIYPNQKGRIKVN